MYISEINIRDPFVLVEDNQYFLYGTRADNFGQNTAGFDVYVSEDLENWHFLAECFNSEINKLNRQVNWAPEVHKYRGAYYMFATFTKENNLRGTYILKADKPQGPFYVHSNGSVTPDDWECLDGTFYLSKSGVPYIVFCHEHTQIKDGTICYARLNDDLTEAVSSPKLIFSASSFPMVSALNNGNYVTDGPFMYRTTGGSLLMIWSTFINGEYAECVAESDNGEIDGHFVHLEPLITNDGGHGMIFNAENKLMLTFHTPNKTNCEHPVFKELIDNGKNIKLK